MNKQSITFTLSFSDEEGAGLVPIINVAGAELRVGGESLAIAPASPIKFVLSPQLRLIEVSESFLNLYGYTAEESAGLTLLDVVEPGDQATLWQALARLNGGAPETGLRLRTRGKDSRSPVVRADFIPALDGGRLLRIDAVFVPETETGGSGVRRKTGEMKMASLLVDKIDNPIVIADAFGVIEFINEGFSRITGYRPLDVVGKDLGYVLQGPGAPPEATRRIDQNLKARRPFTEEVYISAPEDGRAMRRTLKISPVLNENGDVEKFIAVEHFVYEPAINEPEAAKPQAFDYRPALADAPIGVAVTDENGFFEFVNAPYAAIYGYTENELIGKHFSVLIEPENLLYWKERHERFFAGNDDPRGEFPAKNKKGEALTLVIETARLTGSDNRLRKIIFVQDITETKRLERLWAESEERFRQTTESAPIGVCVTNEFGVFESVNDAYCKIFKYEREELVGKPFTIIVEPEKAAEWQVKHDEFIAGRDVQRDEFTFIDKKQERLTLLAHSARVVGTDGRPRSVTFMQDITERKKSEDQIKIAYEEVEAQREELRQTLDQIEIIQLELDRQAQIARNIPIGLIVFQLKDPKDDRTFTVAEVNLAFENYFDVGKSRLLHQRLEDVFPDARESGEIAAYMDVIRNGRDVKFEDITIAQPDVTKIYSVRAFPLPERSVAVAYEDVTDARLAQTRRREVEESFRAAIENAPIGVFIADAYGVMESMNSAFCETLGYTFEELTGRHFTAILRREDIDRAEDAHRRLMETGESQRGEYTLLDRRGRQVTILAQNTRIAGPDGKPRKVSFLTNISERKKNEDELRKLSLVADRTDNAVIITDRSGAIEWVNEGFTRITGYTLAEVLGRKPGAFLQGPATDPAAVKKIREGLISKQSFSVEILNYHKSGNAYWISLNVSPILDDTGNVQQYFAIEADITARKKIEEELQKLSIVADKTDNAVIITNRYGAIEWINDGFSRITGYVSAEVLGRKPGSFLQGADTDPDTVKRIRQKLNGKESFSEEILNYAKDRRPYWISLSITPVLNSYGEVDKFIAIEADITERKKTEDEVRKLSLVASKTENAVIITDRYGLVEWVNDAFEKITGYSKNEVLGKKPGAFLQGAGSDPATIERIRYGLQSKQSFTEEILNYSKHGVPYWLLLNITPILNGRGDVEKFIAIETDITERKTAEQRVLEANERLQKAMSDLKAAQNQLVVSEKMASLGQLISGVAHEINTPISAVKASARNMGRSLPEVIRELPILLGQMPMEFSPLFQDLVEKSVSARLSLSTKEERQARKQIENILDAAGILNADDIAANLVEIRVVENVERYLPLFRSEYSMQIIDMAYKLGQLKVNVGNIDLAAEKTAKIVFALKSYSHIQNNERLTLVALADTIDSVLTFYQSQTKHGVVLQKNYNPIPDIEVYPDEMGQVWNNLIQNAIQAMGGAGNLEIEVKKVGEEACVAFVDSGPGIPDQIMQQIFDPFFTTKPQGEGSGLGLDICKRIVEKHYGRIEVQSRPGKTVFSVFVPYDIARRTPSENNGDARQTDKTREKAPFIIA